MEGNTQTGRILAMAKPEDTVMKLLNSARNWMRSRRTMNELANLSNDSLEDIGLTRFDIATVSRRIER